MPRFPSGEDLPRSVWDVTLPELLVKRSSSSAGKPFLRMHGTADQTFGEAEYEVRRLAGGLAKLGVERGSTVAVFMANSVECVYTWLATNWLGAVWVPLNTRMRGQSLNRMLELVKPRVLICDSELLGDLSVVPIASGLRPIIVNGITLKGGAVIPLGELYEGSGAERPVEQSACAPSAILFTSGSTGPSKGAVLSHRYFVSQAAIACRDFAFDPADVLYCPFPLFHADATALTVAPSLLLGACAALGKRFSVSNFWPEVRSVGATVFDFMGATLSLLHQAPATGRDRDNSVRLAWGVPVPAWVEEFEERFGLTVRELYGSVEANIPVTNPVRDPRVRGSCGRAVREFEVRIANEWDDPVSRGEVGEILIRPKVAFTTMTEYFAAPAATAAAMRNGWFHSGDLGRLDAEGNVYFVGRAKEVIRRRGENISAFEVEEAVLLCAPVAECAALGVPSELTEEELLVCVSPRAGAEIIEDSLIQLCREYLGAFQVPRYVVVLDFLPKTPTGKIDKGAARAAVRSARVWDGERRTYCNGSRLESGDRRE